MKDALAVVGVLALLYLFAGDRLPVLSNSVNTVKGTVSELLVDVDMSFTEK